MFDLTLQVKRWIDLDQQAKIPRIIVKVLKRYISWAKQDAGVSHKDFPPVVIIRAYPLGFATGSGQVKIKVEEDDSTIFGATLLGVGEDRASATGEDAMVDRVSALHVDERPAVQRVSAVSEDIEQRLQDLAKRQRSYYADKEAGGNLTIRPPTLYAFAVVAHIAMLVSLDSITEDSPMVVLDTIDFSRVDQWLWNALSVALPVNMARDSMYARRDLWGYLGGTSVDLDDA